MGARVNISSVDFLNQPAGFRDEFQLEITFEVYEHLPRDLEFELRYVGSPTDKSKDQVLDSVLIGPNQEGRHRFTFKAPGADPSKIPEEDIVGSTALLLRVLYDDREFTQLAWFVANLYTDPELQNDPPSRPIIDKLQRTVMVQDVRVTNYPIPWNGEDESAVLMPPAQVEDDDATGADAAGTSQAEDVIIFKADRDVNEAAPIRSTVPDDAKEVDLDAESDSDDAEDEEDDEGEEGEGEEESEADEEQEDEAMEQDSEQPEDASATEGGDQKSSPLKSAPAAGNTAEPLGDLTNGD